MADSDKKPAGWLAPSPALKAKLHAWWEGYEIAKPAASAPASKAATPAPPPSPPKLIKPPMDGKVVVRDQWPPERVKVAQQIWGDGFTFPGGELLAVEMARPLALEPGSNAADLGCGLGGGTRAIAREYGAWMEGYELSLDLAKAGDAMSKAADMERKAPVGLLDVVNGSFKPKRYDGVLVRSVFSAISEKPTLLSRLAHGMKPGAKMVVVDWALSREDATGEALEAYRLGEATAPRLSTIEQFKAQIEATGFAIRVADDFSDTFRTAVLDGWSRIEGLVERGSLAPAEGQALMAEAQLWARRLAAMAAGELRVGRFLAERR